MSGNRVIYSATRNRPGAIGQACTHCGKAIRKGEKIVVRETQVNRFRGDDEVEFFHPACFEGRKK